MPVLGGDEVAVSGARTVTVAAMPDELAPSTRPTHSAPVSPSAQRHLERLDEAVLTARAGDVRRALELLTPMARLRRRGLPPLGRARLVAALVECRLTRGDLAEAMTLGDDLSPLLGRARVTVAPAAAAVAHHAKGGLANAFGDPASAVEQFEAVGAVLAGHRALSEDSEDGGLLRGDALEDVRGWRNGAALAMLHTGRAREAHVLASEEVARVTPAASPYAQAIALRVLAATDRGAERVPLLRRALAAAGPANSARLSAQIGTDLAGLLVLDNDPGLRAEALGLLRTAEEYAGYQSLWPLHGRVRRLLDRLDEPPHRVGDEALSILSAAERGIATLAGRGLSNREIAERSGVGVKAVEWHLSRVYRKLDISGRGRLAATLGVSLG